MHKTLFKMVVLVGAGSVGARAQSRAPPEPIAPGVPPLVTDRPDFTESPQTAPVGMVQIEGGVTFEKSGNDKVTTYGETLIRVAVGTRAELRLGVPSYISQRGASRASGFDDSFTGGKFVLVKRKKFPIAFLLGTTLPTGSSRVASRQFNVEAIVASEIELSRKIGVALNPGAGRPNEGNGRFSQYFASDSFGFDLSPRVGAFAEGYAFNRSERDGRSQRFIDGDFTYAATPSLQFHARLGFGLNNRTDGSDYFTGVGVAQCF